MDESALNEFESLFEAAVRPTVELQPVRWSRVVVALDGSERGEAAVAVAVAIAKRFAAPAFFLATRALLEGVDEATLQAKLDEGVAAAKAQAEAAGVVADGAARIGAPGEVILAEERREPTSLLVVPTPHGGQTPDQTTLGSTVDHLLKASDVPTLLIKAPLAAPAGLFQRILAYIPGGFTVGPHFSIPFALTEPGGTLELMHVVDADEVRKYAAAFDITPDDDTEERQAATMIRGLEEKMTALLEAAVGEVRDEPFTCRSLVGEGNPIQRVALRLLNEHVTLLVVESESRPEVAVPAEAYAMIKEITGVPILAL